MKTHCYLIISSNIAILLLKCLIYYVKLKYIKTLKKYASYDDTQKHKFVNG